ncbi:hypothetical protein QQ045_017216 [Rhodiola kirilowii]
MDNVIFCDLYHGEHILAMKTRQGTMENTSGTDQVCACSKCIFSSSWLLFWVTDRTVELIEKAKLHRDRGSPATAHKDENRKKKVRPMRIDNVYVVEAIGKI